MKAKDAMLVALGAGSVLAYQKYKKPIMRKMGKMTDKALDKADNAIENMMR